MAINYYVFGDNKSKKEALTKTEVENIQQQIEEDLSITNSAVSDIQNELKEIPVIKLISAPSNNSILTLLNNHNVKIHQLCLIVNNSNDTINFSEVFASPIWPSGSTKTFIYQLNLTKKSVSGTVGPFGEVSFSNFISVAAGSNILFRNITLL